MQFHSAELAGTAAKNAAFLPAVKIKKMHRVMDKPQDPQHI
ncbi:hypothetical protein OU994_29785 [Pseudoduganella sp. SL102]|nr:hypothetical protein [Pseudoduganella sp. SL102]WBS02385.1 hypothetical protein OU994_29785 [Pseudoduganella sp. SL102]